jgi:hypothetical protein
MSFMCIIMFFLQYNALFFLKLYIYIYIYIYIYFLIFLYTTFPPAFPPTFPFFEGLFRIVPVSETSYRFPVSCNLARYVLHLVPF